MLSIIFLFLIGDPIFLHIQGIHLSKSLIGPHHSLFKPCHQLEKTMTSLTWAETDASPTCWNRCPHALHLAHFGSTWPGLCWPASNSSTSSTFVRRTKEKLLCSSSLCYPRRSTSSLKLTPPRDSAAATKYCLINPSIQPHKSKHSKN
jgi:hypothetical protein